MVSDDLALDSEQYTSKSYLRDMFIPDHTSKRVILFILVKMSIDPMTQEPAKILSTAILVVTPNIC